MIGHRRPLFWSPEARADLSDIWNYYSRVAGRHTANNVVRRIGEACQLLEDHRMLVERVMRSGQGFVRSQQIRTSFSIASPGMMSLRSFASSTVGETLMKSSPARMRRDIP
jgi:plasmid stabilization system protein ParE